MMSRIEIIAINSMEHGLSIAILNINFAFL